MIGIVIITHGNLGQEFRNAIEHVMGPQEQLEAIGVSDASTDADQLRILEAIERVDTGLGVLLVSDMFGGVPANLAISTMSRPKVDLLSGINLPLLVKAVKVRVDRADVSVAELAAIAQEAGRKYVTIASRVLAGAPEKGIANDTLEAPKSIAQRPAAFRFHLRHGLIDVAPENLMSSTSVSFANYMNNLRRRLPTLENG